MGGTAAKPETVREIPPADTPDIYYRCKSCLRMAPTRTTAAIPDARSRHFRKKALLTERKRLLFDDAKHGSGPSRM